MKHGAGRASAALKGEIGRQSSAAGKPLAQAAESDAPPAKEPDKQTRLDPEQVGSAPAAVSPVSVVPALATTIRGRSPRAESSTM